MPEFNPLDHPICLQRPGRIAPSTWVEHVPFAMYLMDLLRPRTFVELGTYFGVSYCAFCQAAKSLKVDVRCSAVDTWRGDPQGGLFGEEVLEDLRRHHDPLYGDFSRLIQGEFSEALPLFEDESIDLLHIDGFHTYEAARGDYETWLPKLSARGVILFHDISVREGDFGVWRLWDELKRKYPGRHFEFEHGYGLGVLAAGRECPASLKPLFEAAEEDEAAPLRDFFRRLGALVGTEQEVEMLRRRGAELSATVKSFNGSRAVRVAHLLSEGGVGAVVRHAWSKLTGTGAGRGATAAGARLQGER